jgi:capsular polysaccharide biosynthesis protein
VSDADRAAALSLSQSDDLPGRLWDFGEFPTDEDRAAADLAAGLTSVGFIRAALRRSAWLWCATAVVGFLAGFGAFKAFPPAYQASTSLLLANNPLQNPDAAALDDQAILQSRTVAGDALRKLGLRQSVASFIGNYTVTVVTNRVFTITVKATSSDGAVREANAVATAFLTFQARQLETQERLVNTSLEQQIAAAQQNIDSISKQISQLSAQPASPAEHAKLSSLLADRGRATSALTVFKQVNLANQATTRIDTATVVKGSQVLDPAAPILHSRLKLLLVYVGTGLIAGLALGMFIVIIRALVSDRLRRRDDVARALGAPVRLSVGKVRLSRWRPGPRGLAAAQGADIRRIVAHLSSAVPPTSQGVAALGVIPVDDPQVAALSLASLAWGCAEKGLQVVVADLCPGSPAARLLGTTDPGVRNVTVHDVPLVVAIPDPDDVILVGPLGRGPGLAGLDPATEPVAAACASADLLLTLAALDPAVGGEHLAGWANGVVAVVTAGRSSAARIHAVGEMIRLAGMKLISAVLVGADKTDESIGVMDPSPAPANLGLG